MTKLLPFLILISTYSFSQSFGDHKNQVINNNRNYAEITNDFIRYDYRGSGSMNSASTYYYLNGENRVSQVMFLSKYRSESDAKSDLRNKVNEHRNQHPSEEFSTIENGFFGVPEVRFVGNTFITVFAVVRAGGLYGFVTSISHTKLSSIK